MAKRRSRRGEGSTGKRKDGRWFARTPSPVSRYFYGPTLAEAIRKRAAWLAKGGATAKASSSQLCRDYIAEWLKSAATRIGRHSYVTYESVIRRHILPILGDVQLRKITTRLIQDVIDEALRNKLAPSTVLRIRQTLRLMLGDAEAHGLITSNPATARAVRSPRRPKQTVQAIPADDLRKFLGYMVGHRSEALVLAYLVAGLRRGEALGLKWSAVDLDAGVLYVQESLVMAGNDTMISGGKSDAASRVVPISAALVRALRAHRTAQLEDRLRAGAAWRDTGLVFTARFGAAMWPNHVYKHLRRLQRDAGITPTSVHALRHTAISTLLARGVDIKTVQAIAGHASAKVTLDTYGHMMAGGLDRARAAMDASE